MSPRYSPELQKRLLRMAQEQGKTISVEPLKRSGSRYGKASRAGSRRGEGMSPGEAEYAASQLDAMKARGEILEWWFEPITFILAPGSRYTPDFMLLLPSLEIEFHDKKSGAQDLDAHGITKMKVAADKFPFRFVKAVKRAKRDGGGWALTVFGGERPGAAGEIREREGRA